MQLMSTLTLLIAQCANYTAVPPVIFTLWQIVLQPRHKFYLHSTENLRILYAAEQQYCELQLQQASDPREKEYYKMFLELLKEKVIVLPPPSVGVPVWVEQSRS